MCAQGAADIGNSPAHELPISVPPEDGAVVEPLQRVPSADLTPLSREPAMPAPAA
jgi:hypothetical protein